MKIQQMLTSVLRTTSRLAVAGIGTALVVLLISWMSGAFRNKVAPGEQPYKARSAEGLATVPVVTLETMENITAVGTVQPRMKADVASRLLSSINEIYVAPGDQVEAGQKLAILDDREIQTQLREAEAAATGIEAELAVRQREYARYQQMLAENAVTREAFDQVEAAFRLADSRLKRTNEQINRIKVMLTYTQIDAPSKGIVADRYLDPGDLAVPGKPLLTLHNPDALELHAQVRESLAGKVRVGMTLPVHIDALNLTMQGTVRQIVPRAETTSRSVLVKVALPGEKREGLYLGMFGRIAIPLNAIQRTVVDRRAVQSIGQLEMVDVVRDDGTLQRRFVRTGRAFGDRIEILSGVRVGERLAVQDQTPGQEAKIK